MPSTTLLLWVLTHALLLPHEPATFSLLGPGDLPAGRSAAGLIETGIPAIMSDLFDASGTGVATVAKLGAYGESWTEATYRVGDLEATNPLRPGTPMVFPDATAFSTVSVITSGSDAAANTPGARVVLDALRPGRTRAFAVEGLVTPSSWAPNPTTPPAIAALRSFGEGSFLFTGPVGSRVGAVVGARWANASHIERGRPNSQSGSLVSATAHIFAALSPHEELRALVMAQAAAHPVNGGLTLGYTTNAEDRLGLAHVTWERRDPERLTFRVSGGYQHADLGARPAHTPTTNADETIGRRIDSVLDGAVLPLLLQPAGTTSSVRTEVVIARATGSRRANDWRFGATFEHHAMAPALVAAPDAAETVNGEAARVWLFDAPTARPAWREDAAAIYVADVLSLGSRLKLDGSVRFDTVHASNAAGTDVSWQNAYPRGHVTFAVAPSAGLSIFAGAARSGGPLPPMALGLGDPAAPIGRVYRWMDANLDGVAQRGEYDTLVARIGPGAWDSNATTIDASLRRPLHSEAVFGVLVDRPRWAVSLTGIVRRVTDVLQMVNDGASYTRVTVPDEGLSYPFPPVGTLDAFSRDVATFGLDRYRLTNPDGLTTDFEGLDASLQLRSSHMALAFGATAARTSATTVGRGFRVDENDPGLLDFAANPNGLVNAVGRPFFDRGYTGKIALVIHLPGASRLGTLIRYQDGQPFSRLADVGGLNQGAEPVSAYARGRTRFTFVGTVDVRFQKTIGSGRRRAIAFVDVFDLFDTRREVEELVATTPAFRDVSAVAPPRSARLGLRLEF